MNILGISGSTRDKSYNRLLLEEVLAAARSAGAQAKVVNLRDHPMPFYDGDLEAASGVPAEAERLRSLVESSDLLVIAAPEYNGSISAVLKNAIDWLSRATGDRPTAAAFRGRKAALLTASGGSGAQGIAHLRAVLERLGVEVQQEQIVVGRSHIRFTADGSFVDPAMKADVAAFGRRLVEERLATV